MKNYFKKKKKTRKSLELEPVGSKVPALTGDLKGGWKEKAYESTVVLFCPAQGYPVPSFR